MNVFSIRMFLNNEKKNIEIYIFRFMKMRQANSELIQERKKKKSLDDDIDDNESIESVSDDEFDKYLGKIKTNF